MSRKPPWIKETVQEALEEYGLEPWINMENVVSRRKLDGNTTGLLFEDRNKLFDGKFFAVLVAWNYFEEGYEVTDEGIGPFESVEAFKTAETCQTLF